MTTSNAHNLLQNESSPYLLQHAQNPVNWVPWGEEALAQARREDKPILISIGYSACHWCHVMAHESFEDSGVASIMNEHFICIKVDREERPDIDHLYMDAVQLMTGQGGWPLNCFALPDGKPFFGGTYFPKNRWIQVLESINQAYQNDRPKVEEYAGKLKSGLHEMNALPPGSIPSEFSDEAVEVGVERWKIRFDLEYGGMKGAPKFPMPNNYLFLLHYGTTEEDASVLAQVHLTLTRMAFGGIYDQIGGGFARYSTDEKWKAPHFEKMLYDNGQLLSLFSQAYLASENEDYRSIIEETVEFIDQELRHESGAFYSALDADSEGEEGKYYVWTEPELQAIAGSDFNLIQSYFSVNEHGLWEHGRYILLRTRSTADVAASFDLTETEVASKIQQFKKASLEARSKRIKPSLDDKTLTGWNALAVEGLIDAFVATGNQRMLSLAEANLGFLIDHQMNTDGTLWRCYKNGQSSIGGFLEDYALLSSALLRMYEVTFDIEYLAVAKKLVEFTIEHFDRDQAGFFHFNRKNGDTLIVRKSEIQDNVIPSSNAVMATVLFKLGHLYGNTRFIEIAKQQVASIEPHVTRNPSGYSQWLRLLLNLSEPFYEVAIVGEDCEQKRNQLLRHYLPNTVICGGKIEGQLPILEGRIQDGKTLIYVCEDGTCQLPTENLEEALRQLE